MARFIKVITGDKHEMFVNPDAILNITPSNNPGLSVLHVQDGSIRAISNRDSKGRYSIRNGRFTATGEVTPKQMRCD